MEGYMKKIFVADRQRDDDYSRELSRFYDYITSREGEVDRIDILDLSDTLIKDRGPDLIISGGLSAEWHAILTGEGIVSVVLGPYKEFGALADIVIDYKGDHADGTINTDYRGVTDLVRKLDWDTDFWGLGIGSIKAPVITQSICTRIESFAAANDIKMLEYLCSSSDRDSIVTLEDHHYHCSDIRVTLEAMARMSVIEPLSEGMTFGVAEPRHIDALRRISDDLYTQSRYYFDSHFDRGKVNELYNTWVEKAVLGTFDHLCYCVFHDGVPVGFATFRDTGSGTANIGLVGVSEKYKGLGLGKKMIGNLISESAGRGFTHITTVTQGRNLWAQRLYQSAGFKTKAVQLWYHKWL
jgi:ribosomal protein S18 acetylase RimI-like enzyme